LGSGEIKKSVNVQSQELQQAVLLNCISYDVLRLE